MTHRLALGLVWLAMAVSGIVLSEPAPVDALLLMLAVVLPVIGLVRITDLLLVLLCGWGVVVAAMIVATSVADDIVASALHTAVTGFLGIGSFVIAAFVAQRPQQHVRLILDGTLVAAVITAAAGIAGYFALMPDAFDLFTLYGRASGTFKDPNVFGPFLVLPILHALDRSFRGSGAAKCVMLPAAAIMVIALLVSFSRGAWFSFVVALGVWFAAMLVTAPRQALSRLGIAALGATLLLGGVVLVALQTEPIAGLLKERAALTQSYDQGPEGRFGGQRKALDLIAAHPLGIGSRTFTPVYHHEEAHNVYLSMMMNGGWLGGGVYILLVAATLAIGLGQAFRPGPLQPLAAMAAAAFLGNALEGAIIDSDHWRHFFLQMALVWGLAASAPTAATSSSCLADTV